MPRKKRDAWGSITAVAPSTYRIRFWAKGRDGQYRRRSCTVRGSRKDAERKRAELMLLHSEDAPCPTMRAVWESYVMPDFQRRFESGDLAANTLKQYRSNWNAHVEPRWGDVQCDAIRPLAIQQWIYEMPYNAAEQGMKMMRLLFDYAVRFELVTHNVAREKYIMPSKAQIQSHSTSVWTLGELGELWRHIYGMWWEAAFLLAGFGGMRVGESLGVRSEDISESNGCAMVRVERQLTKYGVSDTLKTQHSRRVVAIPGRAGKRVIELADERDGWLTGDGMGGPTKRNRLMYAWQSMQDAEHLERVPFRNLRNSWQTNMRWSMKLPPWLVEPMMGHAGQGVTGQYYDRPSVEMFAEVMAEAYAANPYDKSWTWLD